MNEKDLLNLYDNTLAFSFKTKTKEVEIYINHIIKRMKEDKTISVAEIILREDNRTELHDKAMLSVLNSK